MLRATPLCSAGPGGGRARAARAIRPTSRSIIAITITVIVSRAQPADRRPVLCELAPAPPLGGEGRGGAASARPAPQHLHHHHHRNEVTITAEGGSGGHGPNAGLQGRWPWPWPGRPGRCSPTAAPTPPIQYNNNSLRYRCSWGCRSGHLARVGGERWARSPAPGRVVGAPNQPPLTCTYCTPLPPLAAGRGNPLTRTASASARARCGAAGAGVVGRWRWPPANNNISTPLIISIIPSRPVSRGRMAEAGQRWGCPCGASPAAPPLTGRWAVVGASAPTTTGRADPAVPGQKAAPARRGEDPPSLARALSLVAEMDAALQKLLPHVALAPLADPTLPASTTAAQVEGAASNFMDVAKQLEVSAAQHSGPPEACVVEGDGTRDGAALPAFLALQLWLRWAPGDQQVGMQALKKLPWLGNRLHPQEVADLQTEIERKDALLAETASKVMLWKKTLCELKERQVQETTALP
eukprot:scaffold1072_cov356-Prasinococcus_capsulatus_cf.AAC.6